MYHCIPEGRTIGGRKEIRQEGKKEKRKQGENKGKARRREAGKAYQILL